MGRGKLCSLGAVSDYMRPHTIPEPLKALKRKDRTGRNGECQSVSTADSDAFCGIMRSFKY